MSGGRPPADLARVLLSVLVIGGAIIFVVPQFVSLNTAQGVVLGIGAGAAGMITGHALNFALAARREAAERPLGTDPDQR